MSNYIWIGPRESDIENCKELFIGSITIFGSNEKNNISYWLLRLDRSEIENGDLAS